MSDNLTFVISIAGIALTFIYALLIVREYNCREDQKEVPNLRSKMLTLLRSGKTGTIDVVLEDYERSCREIERRDHITLLIGSILITASMLILVHGYRASGDIRFVFAHASIGLFVLWLFAIHYTSARLDNLSYLRIRTVEKALREEFNYEFGIHKYLHQEISCKRWIRFRRLFWSYVLLLLSFSWLFISYWEKIFRMLGAWSYLLLPVLFCLILFVLPRLPRLDP